MIPRKIGWLKQCSIQMTSNHNKPYHMSHMNHIIWYTAYTEGWHLMRLELCTVLVRWSIDMKLVVRPRACPLGLSYHGMSALMNNPLEMSYTRRAACPMVPVRHGQPIPDLENRHWNPPEIYRKRLNKKISNFVKDQCDTMLVRIENDQVIDICFHSEWAKGNPWSLETTCVTKKYKEIDCYMETSPLGISQMPEPYRGKEDIPIFSLYL